MDKKILAGMMDHTLLKPVATENQVKILCREAIEIGAASVCVNPTHVMLAQQLLHGSSVKVCTVVGFPLGANSSSAKAFETKEAIINGATEIDMVINIGALKSGDVDTVYEDILSVVKAAKGALVKVIIETCYLTDEEKVLACQLSQKAGADFVKTSTGFGTAGATESDVRLMKKVVGGSMKVKASGGIRNYQDAMRMIEAGADRLGVSASLEILAEA